MNNRKVTRGRSVLVANEHGDRTTRQSTVYTMFHSMGKRVKGRAIGKRKGTNVVETKVKNVLGKEILQKETVTGTFYLIKNKNNTTREIFLSDVG